MKAKFSIVAIAAAVAAIYIAGVAAIAIEARPAPASSACPMAEGALADGLEHRVVRTLSAGFERFKDAVDDKTEVSISLEHALSPGWTCATWSVELLAPDDLAVTGSAVRTGLTRTSVATFVVEPVDMHDEDVGGYRGSHISPFEFREYGASFVVGVQNGGGSNVHVDGRANDGQGRWHFPVPIRIQRD